jgi:hypothetical protein
MQYVTLARLARIQCWLPTGVLVSTIATQDLPLRSLLAPKAPCTILGSKDAIGLIK